MKKTKQLKAFAATCALFVTMHAQSQEKYQYSIGIDEIQSAEAAKESDLVLRPLFDVPANFQADTKLLVFTSLARLEEIKLTEKLERSGFHLNSFSKTIVE